MTHQEEQQVRLSLQEGWRDLEEQHLEKATGGGIGNLTKPLLTSAQKAAAKKAEAVTHRNNGTYIPPDDHQALRSVGASSRQGRSITFTPGSSSKIQVQFQRYSDIVDK